MTRKTVLFFGLEYAIKSYLDDHISSIGVKFDVKVFLVDKLSSYHRRSIYTFFRELCESYFRLRKLTPSYIVSVGPKPGLISTALALLLGSQHIHWFTGQQWCMKKYFYIQPSYICDWLINLFSYKSFSDSPAQAKYLYTNLPLFLRKKIFTPRCGSISSISDKLLSIYESNRLANSREVRSTNFSTVTVGFLGRICEDKGLGMICDIVKHFSLDHSVKFLICGPLDDSIGIDEVDECPYVEFLRRQPNVSFIPHYIDRIEFFKQVDLFFMPSLREGFCLTVVEAQAAGIPVICSDIYGFHDSTQHFFGSIRCTLLLDYCESISLLMQPLIYQMFSFNAHLFASRFRRQCFLRDLDSLYSKYISS